MAAMQSWRKAYGSIKDTTSVSLANLNSDFKDLDVAIVKATNHVECPPKERHLRKIVAATSIARPRADVAYCIHALTRRLAKTRNWIVALKTLVVIHRLLREGDPTFREELLNFTQRGRILQLSNFKDDSSPIAWDCSAWVRTYGLFLEERLECFRILKYDVEAERLSKQGPGPEKGHSRTRELESQDLLEQLPALQQLLYRLVGCRPEGAANNNYLVQYALALVLKESFKIYCAINDGIINLVDKFFEMARHDAVKALEIYRRAGQQAGNLSDFYENCRGLELARNFQFPTLREPPQTFLLTMEEYVREAPRMVPVREPLEFPERLLLTYKPEESEEVPAPDPVEEEKPPVDEPVPVPPATEVVSLPPKTKVADTGDLLGLNDPSPGVSAIEESNALALAIVPSDAGASTTGTTAWQDKGFDPTGWELALVTTPSNTNSSVVDSQLARTLSPHLIISISMSSTTFINRQNLKGVQKMLCCEQDRDFTPVDGLRSRKGNVEQNLGYNVSNTSVNLYQDHSGSDPEQNDHSFSINSGNPKKMLSSETDYTYQNLESDGYSVTPNEGGGFDKLILDSLYDEGAYRQKQQQQLYGSAAPNPFMTNDPFATSNQVAPPPSVQMAAMSQQHQQIPAIMQPNPFGPPMQPQHTGMAPATNPFLDAGFGSFPVANNGHQQSNPFGGTQLL